MKKVLTEDRVVQSMLDLCLDDAVDRTSLTNSLVLMTIRLIEILHSSFGERENITNL